LFCHPCQAGCAAFKVRREGREDFALHGNSMSAMFRTEFTVESSLPIFFWLVSSSFKTYRVVDRILIPRIIVDVNGHRSESGNFGGKATQECIVLPVDRLLATRAWATFGLRKVY
jgi:hypothetical protein